MNTTIDLCLGIFSLYSPDDSVKLLTFSVFFIQSFYKVKLVHLFSFILTILKIFQVKLHGFKLNFSLHAIVDLVVFNTQTIEYVLHLSNKIVRP